MTAKTSRNSPETRAKISAAIRAKYQDPEYRAKNEASRAKARTAFSAAFEGRLAKIAELEAENQQLRNENARLRGGDL